MIGGEAVRHLGTLGNGAAARDQDIDVPGGLTQPVECRLIGFQPAEVRMRARRLWRGFRDGFSDASLDPRLPRWLGPAKPSHSAPLHSTILRWWHEDLSFPLSAASCPSWTSDCCLRIAGIRM